ncbi:MAG TPA: NAD(P)-dependent oxidoreductase, partial [Burkholderiales bacterium]|nr:NAD(P)-dependent oxidoreductase [Burkholderiales bacterium]
MIVVPDDFPSVFEGSAAHERAQALGNVRVHTERGADDENELARRIGEAQVAFNIRAYSHFSEAVFHRCPNLRMISIWGVGTDNIDLVAAARHGITVCNTPGANAIAVAEHAIALMLAVARKIPAIDREMRSGTWSREMLAQLHGKTLGIFGLGNIGTHVATLARAFGMRLLGWSARGDTARFEAMGVTPASKEEIVRQ